MSRHRVDGAHSRHPLADRGHELYQTPGVAVRALLAAEQIPHRVWEPACGPGAVVRELRAAGHDVVASDLVDYGCPGQYAGIDFLRMRAAPAEVGVILTNPPFKNAQAFVEKALDLAPRVVMLLRLAFLESARRSAILENGMLARVHVFGLRLPMMHREGWKGRKASSGMAFAWFVWDREHHGDAVLKRLCWKSHARPGEISRQRSAPALAAAE